VDGCATGCCAAAAATIAVLAALADVAGEATGAALGTAAGVTVCAAAGLLRWVAALLVFCEVLTVAVTACSSKALAGKTVARADGALGSGMGSAESKFGNQKRQSRTGRLCGFGCSVCVVCVGVCNKHRLIMHSAGGGPGQC